MLRRISNQHQRCTHSLMKSHVQGANATHVHFFRQRVHGQSKHCYRLREISVLVRFIYLKHMLLEQKMPKRCDLFCATGQKQKSIGDTAARKQLKAPAKDLMTNSQQLQLLVTSHIFLPLLTLQIWHANAVSVYRRVALERDLLSVTYLASQELTHLHMDY